jgi:hypothetical protein
VAFAVDFAFVVLIGEVDRHRKNRLALQNLCRMRGGRNCISHLREGSGQKGMMGVVRPGDPRKRFDGFGVFFGAIVRAPQMAPSALGGRD